MSSPIMPAESPIISLSHKLIDSLTIVTAADTSHYQPLVNLLWTVSRFAPTARVVAWDLGLKADESGLLTSVPPFYLANWQLRAFDFSKYPPYFSLKENAGRMGFRPVSIATAAREFGSLVLWLDAGCQLCNTLFDLLDAIKTKGFYCAPAAGTIAQNLHPAAWAPMSVTDDLLSLPLRDAGVCGFDTANPQVLALVEAWQRAALDEKIIAPQGSARKTHRQDAVFAVLLNRAAKANHWIMEDTRVASIIMRRDNLTLSETKFRSGKRFNSSTLQRIPDHSALSISSAKPPARS